MNPQTDTLVTGHARGLREFVLKVTFGKLSNLYVHPMMYPFALRTLLRGVYIGMSHPDLDTRSQARPEMFGSGKAAISWR